MEDYTSLDQSSLNGLLSGSGGSSLIPESLVTTMIVCFVLLNLLFIAFAIFYIINLVRQWKVQSAMLHMQKDVAEIKQAFLAAKPAPATAAEPVQPPAVAAPAAEQTSDQPPSQ